MTAFSQCHLIEIPNHARGSEIEAASTVRLALSGLGCGSCAKRVRNALISTPGVVDAEVNLSAAQADVRYLSEQIGPVGLTRVVSRSGTGTHHRYRAVPVRALFPAQVMQA